MNGLENLVASGKVERKRVRGREKLKHLWAVCVHTAEIKVNPM